MSGTLYIVRSIQYPELTSRIVLQKARSSRYRCVYCRKRLDANEIYAYHRSDEYPYDGSAYHVECLHLAISNNFFDKDEYFERVTE